MGLDFDLWIYVLFEELKVTDITDFKRLEIGKMAVSDFLDSLKLISRKIQQFTNWVFAYFIGNSFGCKL